MMVLDALAHALSLSAAMSWEILWALILGFAISAAVQAVVSKAEMGRLLPDDSPRSLAIACGLGAASSSCSYAAVAMARSVFRKGADFTSAMAFQFASTNLVIELGIILAVLLGWQFTAAEFLGGPLMIVLLALLFRALLKPGLIGAAREQADRGLAGAMEGHAAMDMSVTQGSIWSRLRSPAGRTAISHYFVMDWVSIWKDIAIGLLVAGALGAWVPAGFWQGFFLAEHPLLAKVWGAAGRPLVAMLSFVCSIGNVPLAAVLWNGGISFGGVIAFIFADLIVLPILNIYRKYYGPRMSLLLLGTFYLTMAVAGLAEGRRRQGCQLLPDPAGQRREAGPQADGDPGRRLRRRPAPRRPHDVLTPAITLHAAPDGAGGDRRRRTGPVATAKWLTGSIATSSQQVIASVFDQATQRDTTHRRTWIVLVDGARH
jgi:hypothetical protein